MPPVSHGIGSLIDAIVHERLPVALPGQIIEYFEKDDTEKQTDRGVNEEVDGVPGTLVLELILSSDHVGDDRCNGHVGAVRVDSADALLGHVEPPGLEGASWDFVEALEVQRCEGHEGQDYLNEGCEEVIGLVHFAVFVIRHWI